MRLVGFNVSIKKTQYYEIFLNFKSRRYLLIKVDLFLGILI